MAEKAKVINEDGTESVVNIPEKVDKSAVDQALKTLTPLLREHGTAIGEAFADTVEKSMEKVAKAIEEGRALNEDAYLEQANRKNTTGHAVVDGEILSPQDRKQLTEQYLEAVMKGGRENAHGKEKALAIAKNLGQARRLEKSLLASDFGSLGVTIPDEIFNGLKELKDDAVVIRQVAGRNLTLRSGATSIPKEIANATAFYMDEAEDLTITDFEMGEDRIEPKKLTGLLVASNELINDGVNVGGLMADQLRRAYALKENATLIRGTGTAKQPMGLRYQINTDHVNDRKQAGSTSTVQEIRADLIDAVMQPQIDNHSGEGAWILNAAIKSGLMKILTTDLTMAPFFAEIQAGRLFGAPVFVTNAIPDNLGAGDEGEVYYVHRNELMIVDSQGMTLDTSRDASYKNASGTLVSAFSRDQYVMRIIGRSTIHLMYPEAASVITAVDWNNL